MDTQSQYTKDALITKLTTALKVKYRPFFQSIGYKESDLINDVTTFLSSTALSKQPKELFKPAEEAILLKIQSKYNVPIPSDGSVQSKPKPLTLEKPQSKPDKNKTLHIKTLTPLSNKKMLTECSNKTSKIQHVPINKFKVNANETEPHDLLDKLKYRMENDVHAKYIKEQNKQFEETEKKRMDNKKLEQQEFSNYLQQQIAERQNQQKENQEQDKLLRKKMMKQYHQYLKSEKQNQIKKQKYEYELQKEFLEKAKQEKELKKNKEINYTINPRGYFNDDESISNQQKFKEKFNTEVAKYNKQCEAYLQNQLMKKLKEDELYRKELLEVQKKEDSQMNSVQQNVLSRMQQQERIHDYMKGIINTTQGNHRNYQVDKYLKEKEEQDKRKQIEYEKADLKRKEKIEEMKKSLNYFIENKQNQLMKKKENDAIMRGVTDKMYNDYLNEENEKRRMKEIQQKQYRDELSKQIEENKKRDRDEYINSFGIQYGK